MAALVDYDSDFGPSHIAPGRSVYTALWSDGYPGPPPSLLGNPFMGQASSVNISHSGELGQGYGRPPVKYGGGEPPKGLQLEEDNVVKGALRR